MLLLLFALHTLESLHVPLTLLFPSHDRGGFKTNKIISAMPHILDGVTVSGEKFDTVLNVVESTLAAFNLTGEDTQSVVDKLTKATNLSRAKFKD